MKEATFDKDGYPTEEMLEAISAWDINDVSGLVDFTSDYFNQHGRLWVVNDELHIATGGWSGCESIIGAFKENRIFWAMRWISSHRGGKYVFEITAEEREKI